MLVTMWCHTLFNGLARNHFNLRHPAPSRQLPVKFVRARGVKFFNSPTPFQYYCHALFLIKFMFYKKATKIDEIFTVDLTLNRQFDIM